MAEVNLGDLTAYIRADLSHFQRGMATVQQQLGQFQQRLQGQDTAQHQAQQSSQQLAAAYLALARAITQQTQAYSQAQSATLAFRQAQAQVAQQTQAQRAALQQSAQAIRQHAQELQSERTEIARSNQALRERQQALRETAQAAQAPSGFGAGVLQIAGGIGLATGLGALISQMRDFAVSTSQVGARMELLRASLGAIAGSTAAGTQQFQFLVGTAKQLGVAFDPLVEGWRRITAAASQTNFTVTEQQRLLTAVATESRRVGTSNLELQRLMTGLAQVFSKGTLSMEEMRQQIGEALPTAMAATARGLGRTTEELTKLISTGSVGAVEFARAFTRGLEQIQRTSGQMADGATQAFNRLATAWTQFQDALANSGVNQYFAAVANNLREAVEWATRMLALLPKREAPAGPPPEFIGPRLPQLPRQGPTPSGAPLPYGTPEQLQQIQRLENFIARYEALQRKGSQAAGLEQLLAGARAELAERQAALAAIEAQAVAQGRVAEGVAQTQAAEEKITAQQEAQNAFAESLRKKLEEVRKAQETFRRESALAPGLLGQPGAAPEHMQEYLRNQQQAFQKQLQELVTLAAAPPQGTAVPAQVRQEIQGLAAEHLKLGQAIKTSQDAEQKRLQALREREQQAKQAISQEIQLRAQLERVQAAIAPRTESIAGRAQQQVAATFVDATTTIDQALRQLAENPALRERVPAMQAQFEALKASLPKAQEAAELAAVHQAIQQNVIEPLERMAGTYELTKQARDRDTASRLAAQAAGTPEAARAQALADAVSRLADAESQARIDRLGDSIDQVRLKLDAAGQTPMERTLTGITSEFLGMETQLKKTREELERFWAATVPGPEGESERGKLLAEMEALEETLAQLPARRTQALQTAREAPGEAFLQDMRQRLEQLQAPPRGTDFPWEESREQVKVRQAAAAANLTTEQQAQYEQLTRQLQTQKELNYVLDIYYDLADGIGSAWISTLDSIAQGTKTVSEAFKEMGRSILQTMSNIAAQEGMRALFKLGANLLTSALTSSFTVNPTQYSSAIGPTQSGGFLETALAGGGGSGGGGLGGVLGYQHGGVITRPTLAMLGEAGKEYVLNQRQMDTLLRSTPQAGGQAGGGGGNISILNFPSRAAAEEHADRERAQGRQAILNEVISDLSRGSGSQIGRMMRLSQQ